MFRPTSPASRRIAAVIGTVAMTASVIAIAVPAEAVAPVPTLIGWGGNGYGQIGDGTTDDQTSPVGTSAGDSNGSWSTIDGGYIETCGKDTTGDLFCWGDNSYGQLGDGTNDSALEPIAVSDGANGSGGWKQTSVASNYVCAIGNDDRGYCWGYNGSGTLGDGTTNNSTLPGLVLNGANSAGTWKTLSSGSYVNCGTGTDDQAYCWGYGSGGAIGNGSNTDSYTPEAVLAGANSSGSWKAVAAGSYHVCGIGNDDKAYCWGDGSDGNLGDGNSNYENLPVAVANGENVAGTYSTLSSGYQASCGLATDSNVYCWGDNSYGQLGDGTTNDANTPVKVDIPGGAAVLSMTMGQDSTYACAVTASTVYCWGYNGYGQLGDGTTDDRSTPVAVGLGSFVGSPVLKSSPGYRTNFLIVDFAPTAPGAPRQVSALAGNAKATVEWRAPVSNGGSAITHYQVTSVPGGKTCTTNGALSCAVTGLTNGRAYTFTVQAENSLGWSVASGASNSVTPESNAKPPTLKLTKGDRVRDGKSRDTVTATGKATGFAAGTQVVVFSRVGTKGAFKRGAKVEVKAGGTFTVSRSVNRDAELTMYVVRFDIRSDNVNWKTIR